jgi:hypothetical protein
MRKALLNKLEVLFWHNIWRILRVLMTKVKEERIRNEHVQRMFYDILHMRNMIAARQMDFINNVVCGPRNCPA